MRESTNTQALSTVEVAPGRGNAGVKAKLEAMRLELGIDEELFYDMTLFQLATLRQHRGGGFGLDCGVKWTRAELAKIFAEGDGRAALEVVQYLDERGPRVVDWTEDTLGADGKPLTADDDELDEAQLSQQIAECEGEERAGSRG